MDKFVKDFITQLTRIADALSVIAKMEFSKEQPMVDPLLVAEQRQQEKTLIDAVRKEMDDLKIPYLPEMPLDVLQKRLDEFRDKAIAKKKAEEEKAAEAAKAPKTTKPAAPRKDEPKEINDSELKEICTEVQEAIGSDAMIGFFQNYKFKADCPKLSSIPQAERGKFITDLRKEVERIAKEASKSAPATDMFG